MYTYAFTGWIKSRFFFQRLPYNYKFVLCILQCCYQILMLWTSLLRHIFWRYTEELTFSGVLVGYSQNIPRFSGYWTKLIFSRDCVISKKLFFSFSKLAPKIELFALKVWNHAYWNILLLIIVSGYITNKNMDIFDILSSSYFNDL